MDVKKAQEFVDVKGIKRKILCITQKQAEALGVSRSTFQGIKKRIRESEDVNLNTPAVRRLVSSK